MAQKKELTEQEKVAEILKRANVNYDAKKAEELIALNIRCKRCGRTLSSLERITFEDKCVTCMKEEIKNKRDVFVKKYILIGFAFAVALVFGGYCANSKDLVWKIIGLVISAVMVGVSLCYVFYTNIDKILPNAQIKVQTWVSFGSALLIDMIICVLTYFSNSWILYIVLMLAVAAYVIYIAYSEFVRLKEKSNMMSVYERKASDKEYVESITEAIENRKKSDEDEKIKEETVVNDNITAEDCEKIGKNVNPTETKNLSAEQVAAKLFNTPDLNSIPGLNKTLSSEIADKNKKYGDLNSEEILNEAEDDTSDTENYSI